MESERFGPAISKKTSSNSRRRRPSWRPIWPRFGTSPRIAALLGLVVLTFAPALAGDQGSKAAADLYLQPVLAIDPGMHTAPIRSQAVDAGEHYAVTGGSDRAVRNLVSR